MKPTTREMLVADLAPAPYNPREISEPALAGLRASIERWGLVEPIVWNERTRRVVGGHQRLKVLEATDVMSTLVVVVDLPEDEEKALNVTLNNPEIAGTWTAGVLPLLEEIRAALGEAAGALRLDELRATAERCLREAANRGRRGQTEADDVPEPPEQPTTQPGDLWILGDHRIICGDSRDPAVLTRLMDGQTASLYATDPPYGVGYDGTDGAAGDGESWDHYASSSAFERMLFDVFSAVVPHLVDNAAWYTWHASSTVEQFLAVWRRVGIRVHQQITWAKPAAVLGFCMWDYRSEPCLMGWRQGHKPEAFPVPDERTNVWEVDWEGKARCTDGAHPTQKPVRLFELPMLRHTQPGQICLETFSGSGSQIIAAERLGRRCFAIERMPQFVDVAVRRWEQFTGRLAERCRHEAPEHTVGTSNSEEAT